MLANAEYVERELVGVQVLEPLRAAIHELCQSLIGTKHDVFSEIAELDELMSITQIDNAKVFLRVERIARWLAEEIATIDPVVRLVQSAAERDPSIASAAILVSESMASVVRDFGAVRERALIVIPDVSLPGPAEFR